MNTAVHLLIRDQLIFSHTTPDYISKFITRHLILFAINSTHLSVTIVPSRFSAVFFYRRFFADYFRVWSYSPEFLDAFPNTITFPIVWSFKTPV